MLSEGDDGAYSIRLVALNPTLRAECERIAPGLVTAAHRQADDEEQAKALMVVLVRHAPGFGIQAKRAEEWTQLFEGYVETLWDLPAGAVEEAFTRWKRNELYPKDIGRHGFYPKANELFALAGPYWTKLRTAAWRARKALEKIEAEVPKAPPVDKAVFEGLLKDLARSRPANPLRDPPRPSQSPQEIAARLRAASPPPGRQPGDDIGEII